MRKISAEVEKKIISVAKEKVHDLEISSKGNYIAYKVQLCYNPLALQNWYIRYIIKDVTDPDRIGRGKFAYICFDRNGKELDFEPTFTSREHRDSFYEQMIVSKNYENI